MPDKTRSVIAVCIPTYRRNELLRDCLAAVGALRHPPGVRLEILVVDNDAAGGGAAVCSDWNLESPALHYCVEPGRGLASVRNRLLTEAVHTGAEWVAFVDDDETPDPDWLLRHWEALARTGADVSTGPLLQRDAHGEVPHGHKSRRAADSTPRFVACNNVMLRTALYSHQGLRFDEQFNFTGGEDFDFFERSGQLGNRHIWTPGAIVYEVISPERNTWRYLFRRHFTGGINAVLRYRKSHGAWNTWLQHLVKALGKLLGACLAVLLACVHAHRRNAQNAVKRLASGLGYLAGLFNIIVERYR